MSTPAAPEVTNLGNPDTVEADFSVSRTESECVLTLRGSFQVEAGRRLYEAAIEIAAKDKNVIVDCSELEHLDGSAAQVLLALKLALDGANGTLALRRVPESIEKYLGWSGLAAQFQRLPEESTPEPEAPARPRKRRPRKTGV